MVEEEPIEYLWAYRGAKHTRISYLMMAGSELFLPNFCKPFILKPLESPFPTNDNQPKDISISDYSC